ncbi:nuclear pore complex protein DDB_G0274915-like [Penaeus indicus]|uniref:nuclear pore complex protein DDB_G0274915-like n=1 Tax=Penaeus indicus TaxID=29960 RepID=UPI00300C82BB
MQLLKKSDPDLRTRPRYNHTPADQLKFRTRTVTSSNRSAQYIRIAYHNTSILNSSTEQRDNDGTPITFSKEGSQQQIMSKDVSKVDKLPPLPRDRLAQLFPRRRSRVSSSSSDGAPGETPEARYLAATKELVLTRYTHQSTTRMNSECESYDESTEENIQIIKKDMEGDEKRSSGSSSPPKHLCSSIKEKLEQTKEQMQQTRKKSSNKVGVEMPADVDSSWDRPPPCPSARFRVASGASQFREVNFSVPPAGGFGALAKAEPEAEAGEGAHKVESAVFGSTQHLPRADEEEEEGEGEGVNAEGGEGVGEAGEGQGDEKEPDDDAGDAEKAGTSSEGEKADSASRIGEDVEATVDDKGGRRSEEKYAIVGADASEEPDQRASGSGGAVARRLVQVPQSLNLARNGALESDFLRFSSGASTSKGGCQTSLGGSMTEDTELSCGSTRTLDDEERKPTRPLAPKDDRERPVLTATSLAIYTNIEQNGSRSGTCLLCTTAVCTFIVTMVLAVGILIAPKTLAVKEPTKRPLPEPAPPAPPALPASTNASSETPSVAALHVLTITRMQRARQVDGRKRTSSTRSVTTTPPATSGHAPDTMPMHLASPTTSAMHSSSARHTEYTLKFLRPSVHSPYREATFSPSRSSPATAVTPLAGLSTSTLFRKMMFPSLSSGVTSPSSSPPENTSPPSSPEHSPPSSSPADAFITSSSSSSFRQTQNPVTAHTHTPPLTYTPETSSARNTTATASSSSPSSRYYSPTTTFLPPTPAGRERRDYLSEERVLLFGQSHRKKRMN